jgi:hypothetical protein
MLAKLPVERQKMLEAADIIEERGHCKGVVENEQGNVCLYGALCFAFAGTAKMFYAAGAHDATVRVGEYLGLNGPFGAGSAAVRWNNAPERTKEDVVNALRGAALHGL